MKSGLSLQKLRKNSFLFVIFRAENTNLGVLGLDLHSSIPEPVYFFGAQSLFEGIGVARIFDWGGPNHKTHAMTSSEIFKKGTFFGKDIVEWKI